MSKRRSAGIPRTPKKKLSQQLASTLQGYSSSFISRTNKYINRVENALQIENTLIFFKALLNNPRAMGAAMPSSKGLATEMAKHAPANSNKIVVELGGGTGVVTQALLKRGIKPANLIVIERSSALVKKLCERFPNIRVIKGNAANLIDLLGEGIEVNTIISSLPLLSLPKQTTTRILTQVSKILPKGGRYIQFTYSYKENKFKQLDQFKQISSKRIWKNFPPARVDVFIV